MNNLAEKWLTIFMWLASWLVIFWINFAAELSIMMHLFAIPLLLISTALAAAGYVTHCGHNTAGD